MWNLIATLIIIGAVTWALSLIIKRRTVFEFEHALLFSKGRFIRCLEPGVYWIFTPNSRLDVIDARPRVLTIPGQEVLTADGVSIKLSVLIQYQVVDPKTAKLQHENYEETLYAHTQIRLRELSGEKPIDEFLESRNTTNELLQAGVDEVAASLGVTIQSISIKDIMFPGSLKEAFSQVARAKQEGMAALEKARGESAAMRKLANTAKLLDGNPSLYQRRLLQTIDEAGTVVLRLDGENGVGIGKTENA